ncbi:hypothetical protein D3C78_1059750 [compost metagenome]
MAAGHDRQGARLGAGGAAGHRRIHPAHAGTRFQLGGHLAGGGRLQAGEIHQQLAGPGALDDAALAEHHLAHHAGIGQAEHDDIRLGAELGGRLHAAGALLQQRRALLRGTVPDGQRKAGGQQAAGHRQAHQADAGEGDGRQGGAHAETPGSWRNAHLNHLFSDVKLPSGHPLTIIRLPFPLLNRRIPCSNAPWPSRPVSLCRCPPSLPKPPTPSRSRPSPTRRPPNCCASSSRSAPTWSSSWA